ncbi:MAG: DUF4399 domain-containing protein [Gemmatimonadaceae bacterium]|nr:DUF4399 domain-containing protein [Gemmatimonadaceae bacterium]
MRLLPLTACVLVLGLAVPAANAQAAPAPAATPAPVISILLPTNGATVTSPVTVRFRLVNYGVAPAGTNMDGTGHFHVLIDDEAGAPGTVIPADSMHIHYGKGQIEVSVPVPLGRHTLRAVLGDYQHKVIGPGLVSAPVTIRVVKRR